MSRYLALLSGEGSEGSEQKSEIEGHSSLNSLNSQEKKPARYLALLPENTGQDTKADPVEDTEASFEPAPWPEPEVLIVPGAMCLICRRRAAACTQACPRWCLQCQQGQEDLLAAIRQAQATNSPKPATLQRTRADKKDTKPEGERQTRCKPNIQKR